VDQAVQPGLRVVQLGFNPQAQTRAPQPIYATECAGAHRARQDERVEVRGCSVPVAREHQDAVQKEQGVAQEETQGDEPLGRPDQEQGPTLAQGIRERP